MLVYNYRLFIPNQQKIHIIVHEIYQIMMNKIIEEWLNGIAVFFNHLPIISHQTVYNHIFNIEVLIPPIEGKSPPQLKTRTCLPMGRDFSFQWQPPSQRGEMFLLKKLRYK